MKSICKKAEEDFYFSYPEIVSAFNAWKKEFELDPEKFNDEKYFRNSFLDILLNSAEKGKEGIDIGFVRISDIWNNWADRVIKIAKKFLRAKPLSEAIKTLERQGFISGFLEYLRTITDVKDKFNVPEIQAAYKIWLNSAEAKEGDYRFGNLWKILSEYIGSDFKPSEIAERIAANKGLQPGSPQFQKDINRTIGEIKTYEAPFVEKVQEGERPIRKFTISEIKEAWEKWKTEETSKNSDKEKQVLRERTVRSFADKLWRDKESGIAVSRVGGYSFPAEDLKRLKTPDMALKKAERIYENRASVITLSDFDSFLVFNSSAPVKIWDLLDNNDLIASSITEEKHGVDAAAIFKEEQEKEENETLANRTALYKIVWGLSEIPEPEQAKGQSDEEYEEIKRLLYNRARRGLLSAVEENYLQQRMEYKKYLLERFPFLRVREEEKIEQRPNETHEEYTARIRSEQEKSSGNREKYDTTIDLLVDLKHPPLTKKEHEFDVINDREQQRMEQWKELHEQKTKGMRSLCPVCGSALGFETKGKEGDELAIAERCVRKDCEFNKMPEAQFGPKTIMSGEELFKAKKPPESDLEKETRKIYEENYKEEADKFKSEQRAKVEEFFEEGKKRRELDPYSSEFLPKPEFARMYDVEKALAMEKVFEFEEQQKQKASNQAKEQLGETIWGQEIKDYQKSLIDGARKILTTRFMRKNLRQYNSMAKRQGKELAKSKVVKGEETSELYKKLQERSVRNMNALLARKISSTQLLSYDEALAEVEKLSSIKTYENVFKDLYEKLPKPYEKIKKDILDIKLKEGEDPATYKQIDSVSPQDIVAFFKKHIKIRQFQRSKKQREFLTHQIPTDKVRKEMNLARRELDNIIDKAPEGFGSAGHWTPPFLVPLGKHLEDVKREVIEEVLDSIKAHWGDDEFVPFDTKEILYSAFSEFMLKYLDKAKDLVTEQNYKIWEEFYEKQLYAEGVAAVPAEKEAIPPEAKEVVKEGPQAPTEEARPELTKKILMKRKELFNVYNTKRQEIMAILRNPQAAMQKEYPDITPAQLLQKQDEMTAAVERLKATLDKMPERDIESFTEEALVALKKRSYRNISKINLTTAGRTRKLRQTFLKKF